MFQKMVGFKKCLLGVIWASVQLRLTINRMFQMQRNNSSPRQSIKLGFFIDYYLNVTLEASLVHSSGEHLFLLPGTENNQRKVRCATGGTFHAPLSELFAWMVLFPGTPNGLLSHFSIWAGDVFFFFFFHNTALGENIQMAKTDFH